MPEKRPKVQFYRSQYGNFASQLYSEIRGATFDRDIGQNGWLTAAEQDLFIGWLGVGSSSRLLDVACGSGGPTLRIAEIAGCDVDGIDIHADAIETARAAAAERELDPRVTFHRGDGGLEMPFEDSAFDALICIDAINHLPERARVLAEWCRVLVPGGRLVFTDPIVVTGPLTHEEIATRASIGFFLFVPDGSDDELLAEAGFELTHRADRTENMAAMAAGWRDARAAKEADLRKIEGDEAFEGQQEFLDVCATLARERRLSRIAYRAVKR